MKRSITIIISPSVSYSHTLSLRRGVRLVVSLSRILWCRHPDQPQEAGVDDISDSLLADTVDVLQFANQ